MCSIRSLSAMTGGPIRLPFSKDQTAPITELDPTAGAFLFIPGLHDTHHRDAPGNGSPSIANSARGRLGPWRPRNRPLPLQVAGGRATATRATWRTVHPGPDYWKSPTGLSSVDAKHASPAPGPHTTSMRPPGPHKTTIHSTTIQ